MDNQHRKISGYRELTEQDIELMNQVKSLGPQIEALVEKLNGNNADKRWLAIGTTHMQQGLMALTRAVAKPLFF